MFRSEESPYFNLAYYSDADMDAAIDRIQSLTVTDRDAAEATYIEMQQQLSGKHLLLAAVILYGMLIGYELILLSVVESI